MLTSTNMQSSTSIVCAVLCAAVFLSQDACAITTDSSITTTSSTHAATTSVPLKGVNLTTPVTPKGGVSFRPSATTISLSMATNTSGNGTTGNSGSGKNGGEGLHAPSFIAITLSVCAMLYGFAGQF